MVPAGIGTVSVVLFVLRSDSSLLTSVRSLSDSTAGIGSISSFPVSFKNDSSLSTSVNGFEDSKAGTGVKSGDFFGPSVEIGGESGVSMTSEEILIFLALLVI